MRMIVAFEKAAQVRHIGHLDLLRAMQRALRRSGLPVRYSQGFNPHEVLSFAAPLPVGVSGAEELMDVALAEAVEEAAFSARLSAALPPSLPLLRVRAVDDRHPKLMARLRTAAYEALLPPGDAAHALAAAVEPFLARKEAVALRKTKSGETLCDIRPMVHELSAEAAGEGARFAMRLSLTEKETLRPDLLLSVLGDQAGVSPPKPFLRRTGLFGESAGLPVPLMEL